MLRYMLWSRLSEGVASCGVAAVGLPSLEEGDAPWGAASDEGLEDLSSKVAQLLRAWI